LRRQTEYEGDFINIVARVVVGRHETH